MGAQVLPGARPRPQAPAIPGASLARLGVYLRALDAMSSAGRDTVSSSELAERSGVAPATLRKDLSRLGSYGTRGVGYDVTSLLAEISRALGVGSCTSVVIVGAGHLGTALAGYGGFAGRGFRVAALLDVDPGRIGTMVGGCPVRDVAELAGIVRAEGVVIGGIATPAAAAQQVCEALVAVGVTSLLNFAPVVLEVPDDVDVRQVDLSNELQILAFHAARRSAARAGQAVPQPVPHHVPQPVPVSVPA